MSLGGGSSSQTQNANPWSGAQPYLLDIMSQAQGLYNNGSSYAPFSTVAPFSPTTQEGLNLTTQRALNGSPVVNQADQSVTNLLQTPPTDTPAAHFLGGMASGGTMNANPATSLLSGIAGGSQATNNPASQYLAATASGANLNSNPYINSNFNNAAQQIGNYINGEFSAGGRGGSGANQDVLERNLNQLASTMYGQNYQNETQLQQNAANSIQNAFTSGQGSQLNAAGQIQGAFDTGAGNTLNAANSIQGAYNQGNANILNAAGQAPALAGQDYTDLQALLSSGGAQDQQAQAQLNDILSRYQYGQQQPWNLLNSYLGSVSGLGNIIGNAGSKTAQGSSNQFGVKLF